MSTTLACIVVSLFILILRVESSQLSERETTFHTLGKLYPINSDIIPAFTLENGNFRSIVEIHWKRSIVYRMHGNFSMQADGDACSKVDPSLNLDRKYTKLMCVEIFFQLNVVLGLNEVSVPIHIFPELSFNIDPSSIIIDPFMSKPSAGPLAIAPLINAKAALTSTMLTFYGITGGEQKFGEPFKINFPQQVTFFGEKDLKLVFPKVDIDHLPSMTVSTNNSLTTVGDLQVLKQYSVSQQNFEKRENWVKIVKFRFTVPFESISPKTLKFFISTDGVSISKLDSSLTFEPDNTAVLSTIFNIQSPQYDLIVAGKEEKQEVIVGGTANAKEGFELVFRNVVDSDNWQETHITLTSPSPISGTLKVTSCIEDTGKYRNTTVVPQTRLSLETVTMIETRNVNGRLVTAVINIYRVTKKKNIDPLSVTVYIYNSKEDSFKPFSGQLIVDDYSSDGFIVFGIFVKNQVQESIGSDPIYIDYEKNSVFSFESYNVDLYTSKIIETSYRTPFHRPYFRVATSDEGFEYLNLEIFGQFIVLATNSFGTSLAMKIGVPRTRELFQKISGGIVLKDLKCVYVMKDSLQSNMFKFSDASVYFNEEHNSYFLECKEDSGDNNYNVLIASSPFKEKEIMSSFNITNEVNCGVLYKFNNDKSLLYKDSFAIRFNRNTLSKGYFIVSELNIKDYMTYEKPNEISGFTILGGYLIDMTLVKPFSSLETDTEFTVEYFFQTDFINLDPNLLKVMIVDDEKKTFFNIPNTFFRNSHWKAILNLIGNKNIKLIVFGALVHRAAFGVEYSLTYSRKLTYSIQSGQEISFTLINQLPEQLKIGKIMVDTNNYYQSVINSSFHIIRQFTVTQSLEKFKTISRQFMFTSDLSKNIIIDKSSLQCVFIQGDKVIYSNSSIGNNQLICDDDLGDENYQLIIVGKPLSNTVNSSNTVILTLLIISVVALLSLVVALLLAICWLIRKRTKEVQVEKSRYISMNELNKL